MVIFSEFYIEIVSPSLFDPHLCNPKLTLDYDKSSHSQNSSPLTCVATSYPETDAGTGVVARAAVIR